MGNSTNVVNFIKRRKADLRSVFHSKCCLCGFDEVQEALEFHHVNPKEKSFSICTTGNQTRSLASQLEELKKCILVCANCHRGIHNNVYTVPDNWEDFFDDKVAQELNDKLELVKTHQINYCQRCGVEISSKATYCVKCNHLFQQKCERPNREELKQLIRSTPFTHIAEKYGVSDKAIVKWCIAEGLPSKKSDIKKYTDEEWELV